MADLAGAGPIEPPRVVARGLAWAGRVTLLSSREGVGKSTLVGSAAAAISTGRDFLDCPTSEGRVVLLSLEEHAADVARRFQVFGGDGAKIHVPTDSVLDNPLDALDRAASRLKPSLVVVDSLAALGAAEEISEAGSSAQWQPVLSRPVRLARRSGAAVLLLHHSRKTADDYRDSTAIGAAADVVLLLEPPGPKEPSTLRHLSYRKSRVGGTENLDVSFTGDGFVIAGGGSLRDRILAYITEHPACSTRSLRLNVKGRNPDIDAVVASLIGEGTVEVTPGPHNARQLTVSGHSAGHSQPKPNGHSVGADGAQSGHGPGRTSVPTPYIRGLGTLKTKTGHGGIAPLPVPDRGGK